MEEAGSKKTFKRKNARTYAVVAVCVICVVGVGLILIYALDKCSFSRCSQNPAGNEESWVTTTVGDSTESPSTDKYFFKNAIVTADNGRCSVVGRDILQAGGSAVDGAIASLLCSGVVNPQSHGIGGGNFMVIYNKESGKVEAIDGREQAPEAATQNMYIEHPEDDASTVGGLAVGVPGEVECFWTAHMKYGKLPWKDLFEPSIKLAEEGVEIGGALASVLRIRESYIRTMPNLGEVFLKANGSLKQEGDIMFRPKLAQTYRRIAAGGAEAFYTGRLADDIVKDIEEQGGIITTEDMRNYRVRFREPLMAEFDGLKAYSLPPPSSGAVLMLILNILRGYNMTEDSVRDKESKILTYHRIVEAFKFAFAKRSLLGDMDYEDVADIITNMTSPEYAASLRDKINDNQTHDYLYYGPDFYLKDDTGTSHLCAVDADGNAVAVTSTINLFLGSKVMGTRTGIIFNNEMDDFSTPNTTNSYGVPASESNYIKPGKRPMSSMSPTIVIDGNGDVQLLVGAAGGPKIITSIALITARTLWLGQNIQDAINNTRFHHQLIPDLIDYETKMEEDIVDGLTDMGHQTRPRASIAIANAIRKVKGGYAGYSDERKVGGYPAGY
ncbi:glutathione hydrolase 1 proenzyme-like [Ptychodera flava]|uniref:glutathione hydrolase 1 proenzyme-like n=1 Tax=Ptychodera flava TaxID=63121 RepID=UPI00396A2ECC